MKFAVIEKIDAEIIHHACRDSLIKSTFNRLYIEIEDKKLDFTLPVHGLKKVLGILRLTRRFFRLDKMVVAISKSRKFVVVVYQRNIYRIDLMNNTINKTSSLVHCKTIMHMGIATPADNIFILGEYGSNPNRDSVPIYRSVDGGENWSIVYDFPKGKIRHVHGVYHDPFTDKIWVTTGDFGNENYLVEFSDCNMMDDPIYWGSGSQTWRAVNLFFQKDYIYWIMDSHFETSHLVRMNRLSGEITVLDPFPGPVWYIKSLSDGWFLAQTTCERGEGVKTDSSHLFASKDLENWIEIEAFKHDGLPLGWFKNALIIFSTGRQQINNFYISAEAIKKMDGKSFRCQIIDNE